MDLDILVKYFINFVPSGVLNIKQELLIILKDKELWSVPMAPWKHTSKDKKGGLYPQCPHNTLNHALLILNFLNVDVHKQGAADRFWHGGTIVTFTKAKGTNPCIGLWKGSNHVLIWGRRHVCVFSQKNEAQLFPDHLVWCVEQRSTSPNDILDAEAPFPGELQWDCEPVFLTLCCSLGGEEDHGDGRLWACVPDPLMSSCWSLRGRRSWWWLMIPAFLTDLLHLSPIYSGASPRMLTEYLAMYLQISWDTEIKFARMVFSLLLKQKTWELGPQTSPLGERDLLKQQNTITEATYDWNPSSEYEEKWYKSFCHYSRAGTVQTLSLEVGSNNAIRQSEMKKTHSSHYHHRNFCFLIRTKLWELCFDKLCVYC